LYLPTKDSNQMPAEAAHTSHWEISEVVFGIPLLVGIVLQWAAPLSLPEGILRQILILVGVILFVVGVALIVLARREFARHGQPTDPGRPTGKVVTTGVFSLSRNPLYLGCVGLVAGAALALNALWVLALLVPAVVACHVVLIAPEERYLAAKFGEEYRAYTASVHRWLGRRRVTQ
jgi:protein-S-isoprenylcysteine O-methyltransferase Ste14